MARRARPLRRRSCQRPGRVAPAWDGFSFPPAASNPPPPDPPAATHTRPRLRLPPPPAAGQPRRSPPAHIGTGEPGCAGHLRTWGCPPRLVGREGGGSKCVSCVIFRGGTPPQVTIAPGLKAAFRGWLPYPGVRLFACETYINWHVCVCVPAR